jgi:hypothetical protein
MAEECPLHECKGIEDVGFPHQLHGAEWEFRQQAFLHIAIPIVSNTKHMFHPGRHFTMNIRH